MDIVAVKEMCVKKGYLVSIFETAEDAAVYLGAKIDHKVVGFGDSVSLLSMQLYEKLISHNRVYDPQNDATNDFIATAKKALTAEIFITSVNAMAETGEMVNIDGTGNRLAGSLFGHEKVYFVVGANKIEPTLEKAIWRARNIAAPMNAKRLKIKTPCAINGDKCYNCSSPERICNGLLIYLSKMQDIEMELVFIKENIGL